MDSKVIEHAKAHAMKAGLHRILLGYVNLIVLWISMGIQLKEDVFKSVILNLINMLIILQIYV